MGTVASNIQNLSEFAVFSGFSPMKLKFGGIEGHTTGSLWHVYGVGMNDHSTGFAAIQCWFYYFTCGSSCKVL